MSEAVIKIKNLSKEYKLGVISHRTLYRDVQSFVSRLMKKDDPNTLIELNKDNTKYNKENFLALSNISMEIYKGEVLGIIGKNGAGKSTLLKILSRITSPTSGEVIIEGRIASLLEVGTGFHQELTGRENIYLNGAILGMTKKEIESKFDEIVDFSGINEFIDTPVKRYSSGMYVRLAFAVAAHLEPEILIVDEVLAVGDAEFRKKCIGKMSEVSKVGRTIIFVSHDMQAMRELCTRAVLLENGKLIMSGNTAKVIKEYTEKISNQSSKRSWEHDKPGDNIAILNFTRLINKDGNECSLFMSSQEIGVEVGYELVKSNFRVNIGVTVYSISGEVIFVSFPKKELIRTIAGYYSMICWIPSNLLNSDVYSLRINAHTFYPTKKHFDIINALHFEVINDEKIHNLIDYEDKLAGILKINCNWELSN